MSNKNVCCYAKATGKDAKGVDALIGEAVSSAKTMKEKVQVAGIAILIHAEKCGDYRKANDLVKGLGDGVNGAALVEWFVKFGGFTISPDGDCFDGWKGAEYIQDHFNGKDSAKTTAWYSLKKINPYKGFDLVAALKSVVKRAEAANDMLDKVEVGDSEERTALEDMITIDKDALEALEAIIAKAA